MADWSSFWKRSTVSGSSAAKRHTEICFRAAQSLPIDAVNVRIARDGVEIGECDWENLEELVNEGQVLLTDHYWYEGMPDWRPLEDLIGYEEPSQQAAEPSPHLVDWETGEPIAPLPLNRRQSIPRIAIGCGLAAATITALYLLLILRANRPEVPPAVVHTNPASERTSVELRSKATTELMARLDKLPVVASPPLFTFYSDLSVAVPDPPAPLTARIRGLESVVDPTTRKITSQTTFVIKAQFKHEQWSFRHYEATVNDLVHRTATEIRKGAQAPIPPAIISLLGLKIETN